MIFAYIFDGIYVFWAIWCPKGVISMRKTAEITKQFFSFFMQVDEIRHMHEKKYRFCNPKFAKCDFDHIFAAFGSRKTRINDYWTKK